MDTYSIQFEAYDPNTNTVLKTFDTYNDSLPWCIRQSNNGQVLQLRRVEHEIILLFNAERKND